MSLTATALLNQARAQRGFREGPNNGNPFDGWLPGNRWLRNARYCASFLSWCAWRAAGQEGLAAIGGGFYNCALWSNTARRKGMWLPHTKTPRRGDLVMFDWTGRHRNSMHVGVVERVDGDVLVTWEANTTAPFGSGDQSDGGGVYQRRRSGLYVVGFVRPRYGAERARVPLPRSSRGARRTVPPLLVDGVWGRRTTEALQTWLRVSADGVLGPQTRLALQRKLSVRQDGVWGPGTFRALQTFLRVPRTGRLDRATRVALQRYLNRVV